MSQVYSLVFRLESPLHLGAGTLGFVELTRLYALTRTVWGALTRFLTHELFSKPEYEDFMQIGQALGSSVNPACSCFFPGPTETCYFVPRYQPDLSLSWFAVGSTPDSLLGSYSDELFRSFLVSSYASQSPDYEKRSTAEGMLHEIETLQPLANWMTNVYFPTFLHGYVQCPEKLEGESGHVAVNETLLERAFKRLFLGGNSTQGNGWLKLIRVSQTSTGKIPIYLSNYLLQPLSVAELHAEQVVTGKIEMELGRILQKDDSGTRKRALSPGQLVWLPGTEVKIGD